MRLFKKTPEDLKTALGQCFWIGLNGTSADDPETKEIFKHFQPGGVILFQRNVESIGQITSLNSALQKMSTIPLFIAVDQEGGIVERLHPIIGSIPPAMAMAATHNKRLIRQIHATHSRILRALGFNVNFTPVLDLALQNADNGLGTRCFSNDPRLVVRCAREVIEASKREGVLISGKHFPGLGDTDRDSHLDLPVVPRPWKQIRKQDLAPYKALLGELPFIMVNHALYPEKNKELPASLSKEIVQEFLLTDWNYGGVSISDDLIMGAVSKLYNLPQAAEHAVRAGNHSFLICKPEGVVQVYKRLLSVAKSEERFRTAIFRNSNRILAFKFQQLKAVTAKTSVEKEIRRLRKERMQVSEKAITLLSGGIDVPSKIHIFLPQTKWLHEGQPTGLVEYLDSTGISSSVTFYSLDLDESSAESLASTSTTEWNLVVLGSVTRDSAQIGLVRKLIQRKKRVAIIYGAYPPDFFPEGIEGAIGCYWTHPDALKAAGMVLSGERKARGVLPLVR